MMRKLIVAGVLSLASASVALSACAADNNLQGQSEPDGYATKTIVIGPETTYVNVNRGDVVKFVVGSKTFSWDFSGPTNISEVTLNQVAPAGTLDHTVRAYIKRMPAYDGG
jgi:hypothetical protein